MQSRQDISLFPSISLSPLVSRNLDPVVVTLESVVATIDSVVANLESVAPTLDPVVANLAPVVATLESVAATLDSVVVTLEPVVTNLEFYLPPPTLRRSKLTPTYLPLHQRCDRNRQRLLPERVGREDRSPVTRALFHRPHTWCR